MIGLGRQGEHPQFRKLTCEMLLPSHSLNSVSRALKTLSINPVCISTQDFFLFLEIKPQILNLKVHRAHLVKRTVCSVGGKFKNRPFPTQLWFSPTDQRAQGLWPCVRAFTTAECEINWKTKIYSASMGLTNLLLSKTEKKKKNLSFEAQRCEVEFLQT